ncbi:hypothetical protein TELCIR_03530 [Teladorsagia circumcincta]|uniref:Integrase catalytic domain-containing protein n=1 Tax=Teladorsagia circumcincta TaxID=45464 RepID=A0A2G9UXM1_TELCI|nr:hypothetical protein TELCIR_03530 [Teladorsagia circumcincta]
MTRMKKGYVSWMNINRDIEENVRHCNYCLGTAKMPRKTVLSSWPDEKNRVHIDYAGPINGEMYLVIVDSYSKWPVVSEMLSSTAKATLIELNMLFARYGDPRETAGGGKGPRNARMEKPFSRHHGAGARLYQIGESSWIRNYLPGHKQWILAHVKSRIGRVLYDVIMKEGQRVEEMTTRCEQDQKKK